jgi:CheY-like chemotaxis protein
MSEVNRDQVGRACFQNTILLVDDEAPIRLLMWSILDRAGYTVHVASDGFDALRKMSEIGVFDLLVTDLSMPGMTGIQLARQAVELIPHLAVIYATGSQDCFPETRADITCLTKPFTVDELLAGVHSALNLRATRVGIRETNSIRM